VAEKMFPAPTGPIKNDSGERSLTKLPDSFILSLRTVLLRLLMENRE